MELLQPHALIVELSAMAEPKPEAASEPAKGRGKKRIKEWEEKRKDGLSVLVQVEGVCTKCESSLVFHTPKLRIQRWLNYEDQAAPVCAKCGPGGGLLKPGRALRTYHNGEPWPLPDRF